MTLLSGNVFAQAIPFLFAPFLARIFNKEEVGIQGAFLATAGIISIIAGGRYELAVILPKSDKKAKNLIVLALTLTVIISFLSLSVNFFDKSIEAYLEVNDLSKYLPYIPIAILFTSLIGIITQWLVRKKLYRSISITKIVQSLAINIITLSLGYLEYGTDGLIYGWIIGQIITFITLFYIFKKDFSLKHISKAEIKNVAIEHKDFPMINSIHAFADLFFSTFIILAMVTKEYGLVSLGLFVMMNKYLKAPIRIIGAAVGQIYYKEANDKHQNNQSITGILFHSVKLISYFAIPISLVIFFFGEEIFSLYLSDKWRLSGKYAEIMAIPILFNFLVSPISTTVLIFNKQKVALIISLIGYVISAGCFYLGVYLNWGFEDTLKLFAFSMSLYYIYLLFWYIFLAKNNNTIKKK